MLFLGVRSFFFGNVAVQRFDSCFTFLRRLWEVSYWRIQDMTHQFNPDMVTDVGGRQRLATQIAEFLDSDTTVPVPTRNDWLGDVHMRALESVVVQGRTQYAEYADLCKLASDLVKDPAVRCYLLLGEINGLRRLPEGERNDGAIELMLKLAYEQVEALPKDNQRRARLIGLAQYHWGQWLHDCKDDPSAYAEFMAHSAIIAIENGDAQGASISSFSAAVGYAEDAFVRGTVGVWGGDVLTLVGLTYETLDRELNGVDTPDAKRWWGLNAPIHLIWLWYMAGEQESIRELVVQAYFRMGAYKFSDEDAVKSHKDYFGVTTAMLLEKNDPRIIAIANSVIADEEASSACRIMAHILAVDNMLGASSSELLVLLQDGASITGNGTHWLHAVVQRQLDTIGGFRL